MTSIPIRGGTFKYFRDLCLDLDPQGKRISLVIKYIELYTSSLLALDLSSNNPIKHVLTPTILRTD